MPMPDPPLSPPAETTCRDETGPSDPHAPDAPSPPDHPTRPAQATEIGGPKGPEPTRYGDWERNGRCTDF